MDPINKIVGFFKSAKSTLGGAVSRLFGRGKPSNADTKEAAETIDKAVKQLNKQVDEWARDNLTKSVKEGVAKSIFDLKEARSLIEAADKAKLNPANREMLAAVIQQTNADLANVSANMERRSKITIRQYVAESMRASLSKGVNTSGSISAEVMARLRKSSSEALDTGIIDTAGRRWKPEVYVEMYVKTTMFEARRQAVINEALDRGAMYAQISSHGAKDACRNYEGIIVKLTPDAPGDYPYYGDLNRREIFHPNCRHVLSPIRDPLSI